jgi:hypothetical protein
MLLLMGKWSQLDLQTEFRTVPQPVQGIVGDSVVLECEPPRGHPEPQIRWKKNGQSLELDLDLGVDSERYVNNPLSVSSASYVKCNQNNEFCLFVCFLSWSRLFCVHPLLSSSKTKQDTSRGKRQLGHHQIGSQRPGTIRLCGPKHGRHPRDFAGFVDSQR